MRMIFRMAVVVAAMAMAQACTHKVTVDPVAARGITSSYETKVPGTFALLVYTGAARGIVRPQGLNCGAWTYEADFADAFAASARRTFEPLAEKIVVVDRPVKKEELAALGYRGIITITPGSFFVAMRNEATLFNSITYADARLSGEIIVDGPEGRLLGERSNGSGTSQAGSGFVCEGGSTSIGLATEKAMRELLRELAESFVNAPRLRESGPPGS